MSLSGSTNEPFNRTGDAALHYDSEPKGPEPTPENPAGVYPQVSGGPARRGSMPGSGSPDRGGDVRGIFSNPMVFRDTFSSLSSAFSHAINSIEDESGSGVGTVGKALIHRLESMRNEVDGWRMGKGLPEASKGEQGGDVERVGQGGLYKD